MNNQIIHAPQTKSTLWGVLFINQPNVIAFVYCARLIISHLFVRGSKGSKFRENLNILFNLLPLMGTLYNSFLSSVQISRE